VGGFFLVVTPIAPPKVLLFPLGGAF